MLMGASLHAADDNAAMSSDMLSVREIERIQYTSGDKTSSNGSLHGDGADLSSSDPVGKRAGAFLRLPMVQLAKEQLSSAQRAARRTPYSRKLKNEAQRERNRCEPASAISFPILDDKEEQSVATGAGNTQLKQTVHKSYLWR
jgi:hypothetical protein